MTGWLDTWLVGWSVGWLAGWLFGWPVGWSVGQLVGLFGVHRAEQGEIPGPPTLKVDEASGTVDGPKSGVTVSPTPATPEVDGRERGPLSLTLSRACFCPSQLASVHQQKGVKAADMHLGHVHRRHLCGWVGGSVG